MRRSSSRRPAGQTRDQQIDRLTAIIKELQRHRFGRRSERLDPDQLALALEDVEQTLAAAEAEDGEEARAREAGRSRRSGARSIAARCRCICRARRS